MSDGAIIMFLFITLFAAVGFAGGVYFEASRTQIEEPSHD